ncbi:hypothetical protein HDV05_006918, partial [Chytridiales sp. JEL 0842]
MTFPGSNVSSSPASAVCDAVGLGGDGQSVSSSRAQHLEGTINANVSVSHPCETGVVAIVDEGADVTRPTNALETTVDEGLEATASPIDDDAALSAVVVTVHEGQDTDDARRTNVSERPSSVDLEGIVGDKKLKKSDKEFLQWESGTHVEK